MPRSRRRTRVRPQALVVAAAVAGLFMTARPDGGQSAALLLALVLLGGLLAVLAIGVQPRR